MLPYAGHLLDVGGVRNVGKVDMSRSVRDASLDTRTARGRLRSRGKPYWRQLEPGLHIGYHKPLSGPGKWVVRHHLGGKSDYVTDTFGTADDFSDADGIAILSFWQAQGKAREQMVRQVETRILAGERVKGAEVISARADWEIAK